VSEDDPMHDSSFEHAADHARREPDLVERTEYENLYEQFRIVREQRTALRAALAALEQEMRDDPDVMRRAAYWADRLAALLQETP